MASVIILQRVVPHYRVPLFRRLYDLFGWQVVSDAAARDGLAQTEIAGEPFPLPYEFTFPTGENPYRANVDRHMILNRMIEGIAEVNRFLATHGINGKRSFEGDTSADHRTAAWK